MTIVDVPRVVVPAVHVREHDAAYVVEPAEVVPSS